MSNRQDANREQVAAITRPGPRKQHTIRFSDAEWEQISAVARQHEISPSLLVRQTMVSMSNGKLPMWFEGTAPVLSPGILAQIEKIYRGVYILATLKRDEMYENGQRDKLDAVLDEARITQAEIVEDALEHEG